jgi:hypothetical protein
MGVFLQSEYADSVGKQDCLILLRLRRCGGLLHQCGILLRQIIHLNDGAVDCLDTGSLLLACLGYLCRRCSPRPGNG